MNPGLLRIIRKAKPAQRNEGCTTTVKQRRGQKLKSDEATFKNQHLAKIHRAFPLWCRILSAKIRKKVLHHVSGNLKIVPHGHQTRLSFLIELIERLSALSMHCKSSRNTSTSRSSEGVRG